jgi:hypothetical protein
MNDPMTTGKKEMKTAMKAIESIRRRNPTIELTRRREFNQASPG